MTVLVLTSKHTLKKTSLRDIKKRNITFKNLLVDFHRIPLKLNKYNLLHLLLLLPTQTYLEGKRHHSQPWQLFHLGMGF